VARGDHEGGNRIEAMANSKSVELDERTAAELWEIAARFESSTCPVR
jgi:hypothetical protein